MSKHDFRATSDSHAAIRNINQKAYTERPRQRFNDRALQIKVAIMNQELKIKLLIALLISAVAVTVNGCGFTSSSTAKERVIAPPATAMPSNAEAAESAIRFL